MRTSLFFVLLAALIVITSCTTPNTSSKLLISAEIYVDDASPGILSGAIAVWDMSTYMPAMDAIVTLDDQLCTSFFVAYVAPSGLDANPGVQHKLIVSRGGTNITSYVIMPHGPTGVTVPGAAISASSPLSIPYTFDAANLPSTALINVTDNTVSGDPYRGTGTAVASGNLTIPAGTMMSGTSTITVYVAGAETTPISEGYAGSGFMADYRKSFTVDTL